MSRLLFKTNAVDPRSKLFHTILMGVMMFVMRSNPGVLLSALMMAGFLLFFRKYRQAFRLAAAALILYAVVSFCSRRTDLLSAFLALMAFMFLKFTPMIGVFVIMVQTVEPNELINALERLHLPRSIALTLAVTLRFIPTVTMEFGYIRDSMKTRGIDLTPVSFIRQPLRMSEYVFIPMMMRFAKIAEELAAAAVTRGVETPGPRGSMTQLQFKALDLVYLAAAVSGCILLAGYEYQRGIFYG